MLLDALTDAASSGNDQLHLFRSSYDFDIDISYYS